MGDLSAEDFDLKYTPTNRDFSLRVPRGQGRRPVTPFFSVFGKTDYLVHGNSFITVTRNGSDVTDRSITWRRLRIWSLTGESGFSVSSKPVFQACPPRRPGPRSGTCLSLPWRSMVILTQEFGISL